MKKIAYITAVAFGLSAATAGFSFAISNNDNGDGQGQAQAYENCVANILKQYELGLTDKNKNKPDAPTNCDHFWN